jgi:hypothetical protein
MCAGRFEGERSVLERVRACGRRGQSHFSHRASKNWDSPRRGHFQSCISRFERLETRSLLSGLSWASGPVLPVALGNAAALDTGQGVLVVGGTTSASGNTTPTTAQILDPTSNQWTSAFSAFPGRNAGGIGATGSLGPIVGTGEEAGYKYVTDIFQYGGATAGQPTASASNYDLYATGETPSVPSMSVARYKFAYATDPATGDLYAIGGLGASNQALSSVERYDPSTDSWSMIASLPQAISYASAAPDGAGHILVFGGVNSASAPVSTVYSYTIANDSWSVLSTMPVAAGGTAAVYGAYGQIYVIGGKTSSGATSSVYVFNPVTNQWDSDSPLPTSEYGTAAVIDSNGILDVIGGFNSGGNPVNVVYQSAALPAPVGLPAVPTIELDSFFTYDGTPHAASAVAIATDGYTQIAGTFSYTYDGSATPPTNAGTYSVLANFTSGDPQYVDTVTAGTLYIDPAVPALTVSGGGTITFDGSPHPITATAVGVDGVTPVSGSFAFTYNGSSSAPVNPGTYTAIASFTSSDANYANASATTTITIPDPTIPTGVTAVGASTNSIQVSWNPVAGAAYYNVHKRFVLHDPRGSGSTITYPVVAGNLTGTSVNISVSQINTYTFYVTSVSSTGVESPRSLPASAQPLYAPSLASFLWNGAVMSSANLQVGQTLQVTLLGYGNLPPTYALVSGPANMTLDPNSGAVTFSPTAGEVGTFYATFTATNSVGTSTATFAFTVGPSLTAGDWSQDGAVSVADVGAMMNALGDQRGYQSTYGVSDPQLIMIGDANRDGTVSNTDLQELINQLAAAAAGGGGSAGATAAQSAGAVLSVADSSPSAASVALSRPTGSILTLPPSSTALLPVITTTEHAQIGGVAGALPLVGDGLGPPAAPIQMDASNARASLGPPKPSPASSVDNQTEFRQLPNSWFHHSRRISDAATDRLLEDAQTLADWSVG